MTMNTIAYNNQSQLIVTIDDVSLVKKISEAVKLIKGVSSVSISKPKNSTLQSASYKAGLEDIKNGNVTSYSSSDEMFSDLMKWFAMAKYTLIVTSEFKKTFKLCQKRGLDMSLLKKAIDILE